MNTTRRYAKLRPLIAGDNRIARGAGTISDSGSATSMAQVNAAIAAHAAIVQAHMTVGQGLALSGAIISLGTPNTVGATTINTVGISTHAHAVAAFSAGSGNSGQLIKFDGTGGIAPTKITTPHATGTTSFVSGFTGSGYRVFDNSGIASAEVDELVVRGRMRVYELLVHQIRATNGSIFVSNTGKIKTVTGSGPYTLTVEDDTFHGFAANDLIRAQRFTGSGVYQSNMTVTSVTNATTFVASLTSGNAPAPGMDFVRLGNTTDSTRRASVYMTADDTDAPFIDVIDGVSSFAEWGSASKIKVRLGKLVSGLDANLSPSGYGLYGENVFLKGSLSAAGDVVRIDGTGMRIKMSSTSFDPVFSLRLTENSSGTQVGAIYGVQTGSEYSMNLLVTGVSGKDPNLIMQATSSASDPTVILRTIRSGGGGNTSITMASAASSVGTITFLADSYMRFGNKVSIGNNAPDAMLHVMPSTASVIPLILDNPAGSTAAATHWQSNGTNYLRISPPTFSALAIVVDAWDYGNTPGPAVRIGRNNHSSTPAAGRLIQESRTGTPYVFWVDNTGLFRISTSSPIFSTDTSGTVVGSQSSALAAKDVLGEVCTPSEALGYLQEAAGRALRRFKYKHGEYNGQEFEGLVVDYAPRYGMDEGRSLNLPTVVSDLIQAVTLLAEKIEELQHGTVDDTDRGAIPQY